MTVAAVRKYKGHIIIASDSQISYGNAGKELSFSKILKFNGITFAYSGTCSVCSLLPLFFDNYKLSGFTQKDILIFLNEFDIWLRKKSNDSVKLLMQAIITNGNKIFRCYDFFIEEIKEYSAVGCGMFVALGALAIGATPVQAVEATIKHDIYCGGEIQQVRIDF